MTYTQQDRRIAVETPLGPDVLLLRSMRGHEALSRLFSIELNLLSENDSIALDQLTGKSVTARINMADGTPRYLNGIVRTIEQGGRDHHLVSYRAEVVPWLWFLTQTSDCRIFQKKKVPDIIQEIFTEGTFQDFSLRLYGDFAEREYCVQYRETDFAFISRLMEEEGIFYFFEHEDGKHTLVLGNGPNAHKPSVQAKARYASAKGTWRSEDVILEWQLSQNLLSGSFALQDFNFETPSTDLRTNVAGRNQYEIYDYPGGYGKTSDGEKVVRTRLEETETPRIVIRGSGNCRGFATGCKFALRDHYRADQNQDYILTQISLQASQGGDFRSGSANDDEFDFLSSFECIPYSTPFRPSRVTARPVIPGAQTAVVVGQSGEEIWTDQYGRVKVQFHWDRYGKADEKSSCWIRVSQAWAGNNWGAIVLPRVGQEVVVSFLEGDPDQPLITGRVYNAEQMPPYALPGEQTKSTIKTLSSKGGGGFNELRFEDKKGDEQIFINAEKNQDIRIKKDLYETVGEESHRAVGKDDLEKVGGDKHLTVTGDQNEKIGGTVSLNASMDYQAKIGMNYGMQAGTEIHLKAGMNFVLESGTTLTLKVGGSFVNLNPAGVFISGPMVMINSGGSAGSGSGASPQSPKDPKEADKAEAGKMAQPKPGQPPKPAKYSPAAVVLKQAAQTGAPFCDH